MTQTLLLWIIAAVFLAGVVFYPRLMFGLMGAAVRGFLGVLYDAFALLLAWI